MGYRPKGPWPVGVADVAYLASSGGKGAPAGTTDLSARLFYPCSPRRSWALGLPVVWIPEFAYARGYMNYLFQYAPKNAKSAASWILCRITWALGATKALSASYDAPLVEATAVAAPLPAVVFSHGIAGNRNSYSSIAIELASQGYVVLTIEHGDGTASVARLPQAPAGARRSSVASTSTSTSTSAAGQGDGAGAATATGTGGSGSSKDAGAGAAGSAPPPTITRDWWGRRWRWYAGFGDKAAQVAKTEQRVLEAHAGYCLLQQLNKGDLRGVLELPPRLAAELQGRLDLQRVAIAGHSYGGATAAAVAAELPEFKCAVALDPWWGPYLPGAPVLTRWRNPTPLLVVGSHDWNTPVPAAGGGTRLKCDGEGQEKVLAAASAGGGGGAVLLVPKGSTHASFDDVLLLFGWVWPLLHVLHLKPAELSPQKANAINTSAMLHFFARHMPPPTPGDATSNGLHHPHEVQADGDGGGGSAAQLLGHGQGLAQAQARLPVGAGDEHAYRKRYGDDLAILRVFPAAARSGAPAAAAPPPPPANGAH